MSETTFNLGRWATRLGWKRPAEPELLYTVQPVQVVSDVRGLTPEVRGPSALYGGLAIGLVATRPTYEFICNAEGGARISSIGLSLSTPGTVAFAIQTAPLATFIAITAVVPVVMTGTLVSTANLGHSAAIFPTGAGQLPGGSPAVPALWPVTDLFIPNGSRLYLQGSGIPTVTMSVCHTVQELPAIRGD